jgi:AcrR family transcriptional regulator
VKVARKIRQSPKLPAATRRQQLLDSARKLFTKKGFRVTTTAEIAENAGLTKGALYFHFGSKEDILFALVKSLADQRQTVFEAEVQKVNSPADLFRILTTMHRKRKCCDSWDIADIWIQAMRVPRIKRFLTRRFDLTVAAGIEALRDGSRRSDEELRQMVVFAFALHHGVSFIEMLRPATVDWTAQIRLLESISGKSALKRSRKRKAKKTT